MNHEAGFLDALLEQPQDMSQWLIFIDWLLDRGDPRGELLQLLHVLTRTPEVPDRQAREDRLRSLVTQGVPHPGPFLTNSFGMEFTWIWPGTFLMGSPRDELERSWHEAQHRVTLTQGFWIGTAPVTQDQWKAVTGSNPSIFRGQRDLPVVGVSWDDCQEFCTKLSQRTGWTCRLPTEAEWEYTCRAGTTTPFHFGATLPTSQANYNGNYPYPGDSKGIYRQKSMPVGSFPANAWGLVDVHGNVLEWCADRYGACPPSDSTDPQGAEIGRERVLRGGSWISGAGYCRSAFRISNAPAQRLKIYGCRVCVCPE
jgi:uncharacterized protein (TIGR02996 family)